MDKPKLAPKRIHDNLSMPRILFYTIFTTNENCMYASLVIQAHYFLKAGGQYSGANGPKSMRLTGKGAGPD